MVYRFDRISKDGEFGRSHSPGRIVLTVQLVLPPLRGYSDGQCIVTSDYTLDDAADNKD